MTLKERSSQKPASIDTGDEKLCRPQWKWEGIKGYCLLHFGIMYLETRFSAKIMAPEGWSPSIQNPESATGNLIRESYKSTSSLHSTSNILLDIFLVSAFASILYKQC